MGGFPCGLQLYSTGGSFEAYHDRHSQSVHSNLFRLPVPFFESLYICLTMSAPFPASLSFLPCGLLCGAQPCSFLHRTCFFLLLALYTRLLPVVLFASGFYIPPVTTPKKLRSRIGSS